MKATTLASVGLGLVSMAGAPCLGQWWWPPTDGLTVLPECLDPTTTAQLTVSGLWHDACIPNGSSAEVNGFVVDITTVREPPPGFCLTVITNWEQTVEVGPLPAGRYTVFATHMAGGQVIHGRVEVGTFDVIASCGGVCYPNCDGSTLVPVLNISDFSCFLNRFAANDSYANCDGSTIPPVLNVSDFSCFLNAFAAGC